MSSVFHRDIYTELTRASLYEVAQEAQNEAIYVKSCVLDCGHSLPLRTLRIFPDKDCPITVVHDCETVFQEKPEGSSLPKRADKKQQ
ncbi:hypothetical protein CHARACLAT_021916 [Characodon lateralis]|uniref:Uncharacterized protein n=1 Tax=Characodon lateralis TaxID=208331 RepID=A0ABU7F509_9TELE|nr:hypothetical protein [Characodon lateralis]